FPGIRRFENILACLLYVFWQILGEASAVERIEPRGDDRNLARKLIGAGESVGTLLRLRIRWSPGPENDDEREQQGGQWFHDYLLERRRHAAIVLYASTSCAPKYR